MQNNKVRITWRIESSEADSRSCSLVKARDPDGSPAPIIACSRLDELPEPIRGIRHAYVEPRFAAELCLELAEVSGVVEVEISEPWERASMGLFETAGAALFSGFALLPTDPSITPNLRALQRYHGPAPEGLGVDPSRHIAGVGGAGVLVVDIEAGWNLGHEQLVTRAVTRLNGPAEINDHGTAVLGILGASDNARGIIGLVPRARLAVGHGDADGDGRWNPEQAIYKAMQQAERQVAGGVAVLEMQLPRELGMLPVESYNATYNFVRLATSRGIHVVTAAGNGGRNLDAAELGGRFDRRQRDSGSIFVGAGASGYGSQDRRTRLEFSNYGSRVDVQGWGQHVVTCGGATDEYSDLWPPLGDVRDPGRCYTARFDGTSAAAPMVAGCVAAILGACRAADRPTPDPHRMRELLRETGTPQVDAAQHIGPLPNLRAALKELALS